MHPVFPFLDRREFEELAFNEQCERVCEEKHAFSALYHTVLALGCQYHNGGSFQPGLGMAWKLFQVALGNFPEMLVPKETLMRVQVGACISLCLCLTANECLGGHCNGNRYIQSMDFGGPQLTQTRQYSPIIRRVFRSETCLPLRPLEWPSHWASIEKSTGMENAVLVAVLSGLLIFWRKPNRLRADGIPYVIPLCRLQANPLTYWPQIFNDANISTPVPNIPEATFDGFDWFRAICRLSRLLSRIQSSLFTTSSTLSPLASTRTAIDDFHRDLETWRQSITDRFRPERFPQTFFGTDSTTMAVKLRIRYHYYSALIALARVQINASQGESSQHRSDGVKHLIDASSAIIDLTRYIDVEPYMPIW